MIVGLGNPILGDDGIGWRVAEETLQQLQTRSDVADDVEIQCLSLGGLSLMEHLIGYDRVILIDAVQTGKFPQGRVSCCSLDEFIDQSAAHLRSAHDTTLQTALQVGRSMGAQLPNTIIVVAIEAQAVYDFSETLSAPLRSALPTAVEKVMELIR